MSCVTAEGYQQACINKGQLRLRQHAPAECYEGSSCLPWSNLAASSPGGEEGQCLHALPTAWCPSPLDPKPHLALTPTLALALTLTLTLTPTLTLCCRLTINTEAVQTLWAVLPGLAGNMLRANPPPPPPLPPAIIPPAPTSSIVVSNLRLHPYALA